MSCSRIFELINKDLSPPVFFLPLVLGVAWSCKKIRKMGKGKKVTKKVVGSASGSAARGVEADGSTEGFTVAGMWLHGLPAAAAEGSGGESMVAGDVPPGTQHAGRWRLAAGCGRSLPKLVILSW